MVTPDPRRGDEPGDPDVTPGRPFPDGAGPADGGSSAPADTPAGADPDTEALGGDDDLRAGQYGPATDAGDG